MDAVPVSLTEDPARGWAKARLCRRIRNRLIRNWRVFWLTRSGPHGFGRAAARLASLCAGPFHQRACLADLSPRGFVDPAARVNHPDLRLGRHVYFGAGVVVFSQNQGGNVAIGDRVHLHGDSFIETGSGGVIEIGDGTHIQPGCHMHSHLSEIRIGRRVEIAANCAFYNYDHGTAPGIPIMEQPLRSRGDIVVGDGAWLGHAVTVLQGVTIGEGAVIAAGAVVIDDIPANAIAAGVPARVVGFRDSSGAGRASGERRKNPTPSSLT